MLWSDDFDYPPPVHDADWTSTGFAAGGGQSRDLYLTGGVLAAAGQATDPPFPPWVEYGLQRTVPGGSGDQWIEVDLTNLWQGAAVESQNLRTVIAVVNHGAILPSGQMSGHCAWFNLQTAVASGSPRLVLSAFTRSADSDVSDGVEVAYSPYTGAHDDKTFRLESYADGRQVVKLNGVTVIDYVETMDPGSGTGQSIHMWWDVQFSTTVGSSPWIEAARGSTGELCDDFERADGPIGPSWITPVIDWAVFELHVIDPVILDGEVVDPVSADFPDATRAMAYYASPFVDAHFIKAEIRSVENNPATVWAHFDPVTVSGISFAYRESSGNFELFHWEDGLGFNAGTEPVTPAPEVLRLEVDADGSYRAYCDDVLVREDTWLPGGDYVAISTEYGDGTSASSAILRACVPGGDGGPLPEVTEIWAWTGTEWVSGPAYAWDGSGWVEAETVYAWSGSAWVEYI